MSCEITDQLKVDKATNVRLNSLDPKSECSKHPYFDIYLGEYQRAFDMGLTTTIYFFEAMAYHERAQHLQSRNLGIKGHDIGCSDDLQENVHIYDTVNRWYAGFSNAPQQMILGNKNPKIEFNRKHGLPIKGYKKKFSDDLWLYLLLIHRITGSGASFAKPGDKLPPHGWYNTPLPKLCAEAEPTYNGIKCMLSDWEGPMFTSVGNQIPPFNKPTLGHRLGGIEYLIEYAPQLAYGLFKWLNGVDNRKPGIQETVDKALEIQSRMGHKKFKFVITAWVMDIAEYFPKLVDPNSDCYHGKNAIEAIDLCFINTRFKKQEFYDKATRFFADSFGTRPMDVEDAAPGCDLIRWVENYIKDGTYPDVDRKKIFHKCYVKHEAGRQRWMK